MEAPKAAPHISVLFQEVLDALNPLSIGRYIDGTLGAGGHTAGILRVSSPYGQVLGLDVDPVAIETARERLSIYGGRVHLHQASYVEMDKVASGLGWMKVNGILLDLGASSMQFDTRERGFSFMETGPLDMRFDPGADIRAFDLVNTLPEAELADILFNFGEERKSRKIARAIVQNRPLQSTRELAELVKKVLPGRPGSIHPATRTFQALRIAVNNELDNIRTVLPKAIDLLEKDGRLAVISFHSLEDRLVKNAFKLAAADCICPPDAPICTCGKVPEVEILTRKPITAAKEEIEGNPRARSAKLRVVRKL